MGIVGLMTGKFYLGRGRVVHGSLTRMLSLIALAPFPLSFLFGLIYGLTRPRGTTLNLMSDSVRWTLIAIEAICVIVCLALVYVIGWSASSSGGDESSYEDLLRPRDTRPKAPSNIKGFLAIGGIVVLVFLAGTIGIAMWPAVQESLGFANWNESPEADVAALPPAPASAGPVPEILKPISLQPRIDRMVQFNRRTMADAYEKVGKKNPKWDKHARDAMELATQNFSNQDTPHAQPKDIREATQKALSAGCNDPMIIYLHYRFADSKATPGEVERGFMRSAMLMQTSGYPPIRKASAYWKAAEEKLKRPEETGVKAQAERLLNDIVQCVLVSAREEEPSLDLENLWYEFARDACTGYEKLGFRPMDSWNKIDRAMAGEKKLEAARFLFKGDTFLRWAWEARGKGFGAIPKGAEKSFNDRMKVAREGLEKSYQLQPDSNAAELLLHAEVAQPRGRAEMEKWFERAHQRHPGYQVCEKKLEWLHPKRHGSKEEMLEFARTCRDSQAWEVRTPMIIEKAHSGFAYSLASESARDAYFRQPEVAEELVYVLAKTVECFPHDTQARTLYAFYCWKCGHPRRSHYQFQQLGDKLWWADANSEQQIIDARSKAAKHAGG